VRPGNVSIVDRCSASVTNVSASPECDEFLT
jgi:hypothetical protein